MLNYVDKRILSYVLREYVKVTGDTMILHHEDAILEETLKLRHND